MTLMDLVVDVEGVTDIRVVKEITRCARRVFKAAARAGEWSVLVSPSEMRGWWDIGVRGPFGCHLASVDDRTAHLPELVAAQLQACL